MGHRARGGDLGGETGLFDRDSEVGVREGLVELDRDEVVRLRGARCAAAGRGDKRLAVLGQQICVCIAAMEGEVYQPGPLWIRVRNGPAPPALSQAERGCTEGTVALQRWHQGARTSSPGETPIGHSTCLS